ncbi:hypothetical protein N7539_004855 [Penicillium diatomitis]|uniref:Zn(2)-C6 fungal-type domain-containing protein n=1 Tax=Penicillium diatomitis TaxID=2819901 RepID=A0A9W9X5V1_9EURO|nr:uncharacterized protein N7539_004855 [Penicillium diatomitis]KAJ5484867.1 hypothetical protein N7539_004855 [Penicillium diatomitis]
MPRRPKGLKSRYGCSECKRRRVKCDETKPSCLNCNRLGQSCSYTLITPQFCGGTKPVPSSIKWQPPKSGQPDRCVFRLRDMQLLHFFTMKTAETLSSHPEVQNAWKTTVVDAAFANSFLLQGLLALAALHLASQSSADGEDLSILAATKIEQALVQFRHEVRCLSSQNCDAVFIFSVLIAFYIPASAGTAINPSANFFGDDFSVSVVKWMRLFRSARDVYDQYTSQIRERSLSILISWYDRDLPPPTSSIPLPEGIPINEYLADQLKRVGVPEAELAYLISTSHPEAAQTNVRALNLALELFGIDGEHPKLLEAQWKVYMPTTLGRSGHPWHSTDGVDWLSRSFAWLFWIPLQFIELLESRDNISLIIFACFGLGFGRAPGKWWNSHIPGLVMEMVHRNLPPDSRELFSYILPARSDDGLADCAITASVHPHVSNT